MGPHRFGVMEKSTAPALLIPKIQKAISLSFLDPVPNSVDDLPTRFRVKGLQLRGPSSGTGTPRACYKSGSIIAPVGLEVCDGGDWLGVMKKSQRPALAEPGRGTLTLR